MPADPPETRRFLALGDSYTIGEGVVAAARWPNVLASRLRAAGLEIDNPEIVAVTGWTSDELAAGMDAAALAPPYALVTLLIGVNDQYRGRDVATYRVQVSALVERAVALAGDAPDRVVVVSIPDWGVTRFAREHGRDARQVAAAIDAFNAAARAEADRAGTRWVDITDITRRCGDAADMLAADGLHPSADQYALWVPRILAAAHAAVSPP